MKRILVVCLSLALLILAGCALADGERGPGGGPGGGLGGPDGNRGGRTDKSGDTQLQAILAEVQDQFQLLTYEDEESGTSLQYQLFIPGTTTRASPIPCCNSFPIPAWWAGAPMPC